MQVSTRHRRTAGSDFGGHKLGRKFAKNYPTLGIEWHHSGGRLTSLGLFNRMSKPDRIYPKWQKSIPVRVELDTLRMAEQQIECCEHCTPDEAEIPFDYVLVRSPVAIRRQPITSCPGA